MTREEFNQIPKISDYFPLNFSSGAKWTNISAYCQGCKKKYSGENLRGYVEPQFKISGYRFVPDITEYRVVAQAFCGPCLLLTPVDCILGVDDKGSLIFKQIDENNEEKIFRPISKKITMFGRMKKFMTTIFQSK